MHYARRRSAASYTRARSVLHSLDVNCQELLPRGMHVAVQTQNRSASVIDVSIRSVCRLCHAGDRVQALVTCIADNQFFEVSSSMCKWRSPLAVALVYRKAQLYGWLSSEAICSQVVVRNIREGEIQHSKATESCQCAPSQVLQACPPCTESVLSRGSIVAKAARSASVTEDPKRETSRRDPAISPMTDRIRAKSSLRPHVECRVGRTRKPRCLLGRSTGATTPARNTCDNKCGTSRCRRLASHVNEPIRFASGGRPPAGWCDTTPPTTATASVRRNISRRLNCHGREGAAGATIRKATPTDNRRWPLRPERRVQAAHAWNVAVARRS